MPEVSSAVAPRFRVKSADFTLKGAGSMHCQSGSWRTLEDASSSSFPLNPQRSVSTSTAATEPIGLHTSVATLVKKRQDIEEQIIHLQVQLLESFREEWILTGVIPEGFAELQTQVIAFNPKLKTTSFPFTHLLTSSQLEPSRNGEMIDKIDCALVRINEAYAASGKPVGTTNGKLACKDSLTSSFSSVMGDSLCWSQWDETSTRTSGSLGDCANDEARELITKRLQSLEADCAFVSQLYRAHKQRAMETNRLAFRKAYKCNAQKLKEIHREKLALEERLRVLKLDEQSNTIPGLTRSSSLSAQTNVNRTFNLFPPSSIAAPPVATLPRRRTLQFPSISASNTLRLGKLRRRSGLKYTGLEKCPSSAVHIQQTEESMDNVPDSTCIKTARATAFSTFFRLPGQHGNVESGRSKTDEESKSGMLEVIETAQPLSRGEGCELESNLDRTHFNRSVSSPALTRPHIEELGRDSVLSRSLEAVKGQVETLGFNSVSLFSLQFCSDILSGVGKNETPDEVVKLQIETVDRPTRSITSSSSSDVQSPSDYCSTTPQSFCIVHPSKASEVCLRRPADGELRDSSIRCICSCISEYSGNCECTEAVNETTGLHSDQPEGAQQPSPPSRSRLPVTMSRKQTRRNLNLLSLLRSRSSKQGSLSNA
ncbi:unnamed protein product [Hydatigera taeniaeformis]|uniref:Uncharacterized protein n=1 Tax=Hydatigena taeniaeformis TaxID=6205 RepID=A0A0R3WP45_HYDTA|nr:unnamed protein product [Hydatigera taeniaeformis]